ncbi:hypothetical protein ACFPPA_05400 [Rhodanobacter ginsengisoli]|uniref:Ribosomal protein L7/L12 C-terminal domain-containing protein n=1 Tax=Rhodanobacter ginsengisoli TaxID=418646 RepID=A0ABW0QQY6_9GAMM
MRQDVTSILIGLLLFVAGYLLGRFGARMASTRRSRRAWKPNEAISDAEIEAEIRAGRQIDAIKLYRRRDGSGLKEAKQAVDAMIARIKAGSP